MTAPRLPGPVELGDARSSGIPDVAHGQQDELKQRYLSASAEQSIGPSERVHLAALAHAQMLANAAAASASAQHPDSFKTIGRLPDAANRSRFNVPLVASLAVACISVLLVFQLDRGDSTDRMVRVDSAQPQALPSTSLPNAPMADSSNTADKNTLTPSLDKQTNKNSSEAASATASSEPAAKATASVRPPAARVAPMSPASPAVRKDVQEAPVPEQQADASVAAAQGATDTPVQRAKSLARSEAASVPAPAPLSSLAPQAMARMAAPPEAGGLLRQAARTGDIAALRRALPTASPAQLNSTDAAGRSALMLAAGAGHLRAVQLLVAAGADAALVNSSGESAVQTARRLGLKQIEAALAGP